MDESGENLTDMKPHKPPKPMNNDENVAVGVQINCNEDTCQHIQKIASHLKHQSTLLTTNEGKMNDENAGINLMKNFIHIRTSHPDFTLAQRHDTECKGTDCISIQRHRNRKLYTNVNNDFHNNSHQINLQQTFDTIHCSLLHDQTQANANSSKFITNINQTDEKINLNESSYDNLPTYQFGNLTMNFSAKFFTENAKYTSLKDEFLSNKLKPLNNLEYMCLYQKGINWMAIYHNNIPKVVRESPRAPNGRDDLFRIGDLKIGDEISIQHIMVIMSYTNNTDLQRKYKKGFIADNLTRFSEVGHWARILYESIFFFGDVFKFQNDTVYHGVNTKLAFNIVGTRFNVPTSTTTSIIVAQNFAKSQGVILELFRATGDDFCNVYFEVYSKYILTDYPNERERIIYGTLLGFKNIIYLDIHQQFDHKQTTAALYLYQQIIYTKAYIYRENICTEDIQNILVTLMQQLMEKGDKIIDPYLLYIFKCMSSNVNGKILNLQKDEFEQLNENLQTTFLSQFVVWLKENLNVSLKWSNTIRMKITRNDLKNITKSKKLPSMIQYKMPNGQFTEISVHICRSQATQSDIDLWVNARQKWPDQYASFRIIVMLEIFQNRVLRSAVGNLTPGSPGVQFTTAFTQQTVAKYDFVDIWASFHIVEEVLIK
eukprot:98359_1